MSQSRFSIVLVGVSALLRRPLVSRLRPADGERSSWVVFAARVAASIRVAAGRVGSSAGRVGLRAHCFGDCRSAGWRFRLPFRSGRWASSFFRLPLRKLPSAGWPSGSLLPLFGTHRFGVAAGRVRSFAFRFGNSAGRVGLRAHCFRFSARADSEWLLGELVLPPSVSDIALGGLVLPLGGLAFGLTASAFRHAPLRRLPSAGWPSGSPLPLFGLHRFGVAARRLGFSAGRVCLRAHGFRFSARDDPHRRAAEARADGAHRHDTCFTSKHLSQHVNLPHRTP